MKILKDKKSLFLVLMIIDAFAGLSNFIEPANLFVIASIIISLIVVAFGSNMAILYLMIALCPFFNSFNLNGVAAGFIISALALVKIINTPYHKSKGGLDAFMFFFFLIWFLHDIQYCSVAVTIFAMIVPLCIFQLILREDFSKYDGYYAMWIVICSSLISMICIFMVQGADLDSFIYASHAGEMRLGEADTTDGQKNQLGGAMGFPIYTITVITLFLQMLIIHKFGLLKKTIIISVSLLLFFITFLTLSRVYILGLVTLLLLLALHILRNRSVKTLVFVALASTIIFTLSMNYLSEYINLISEQYASRIDYDGNNSGTGIRGTIYADCINYISTNMECFFIGKGNRAYPLIGAELHRPMSMSAHNIILDAIMSFGVFGSLFLLAIYGKAYKTERDKMDITWPFFRIIPFACVFIMYQTGSPFLQDKTYPFLLFLILNIFHCTDKCSSSKVY